MKRILVTEPIHEAGLAVLSARDDVEVHRLSSCDEASLLAAVPEVDGILVRSALLTPTVLAAAAALKVVARHGVGCDNIAVAQCTARQIPVAITANANATSVAEHVIMMIMMLTKQPVAYDQATRQGRFHDRGKFRTSELSGKTVLIIGHGRIGRRLAPLCKAFGMRVIVIDIALDRELAAAQGCEGYEDFRPYLAEADIVSIHVPLDDDTRNLIGAEEIAQMPAHAVLINCARGGIVDERALAAAVLAGDIAGTGCDVFSTEPPAPDNPLLGLPNSILTPHSAAVTQEGARRMAVEAAQNILDALEGRLPAASVFNARALGLSS